MSTPVSDPDQTAAVLTQVIEGTIGVSGSTSTTRTDTFVLERRAWHPRSSTTIISFRIADVAVNLIDTPGHPDFIAEVGTVAEPVLDGAVLVVLTIKGVQPPTASPDACCGELRVPTLLFVDEIDQPQARTPTAVLARSVQRLSAGRAPDGLRPADCGTPSGHVHGVPTGGRRLPASTETRRPRRARRRSARRRTSRAVTAAPRPAARGTRPPRPRDAAAAPGLRRLGRHRRGRARLMPGIGRPAPDPEAGGRPRRRAGCSRWSAGRPGRGRLRPDIHRLGRAAPAARPWPEGRVGKVSGVQLFEAGHWVRGRRGWGRTDRAAARPGRGSRR